MINLSLRRALLACVSFACFTPCGLYGPAHAEEAVAPIELEGIVVTSRKREESDASLPVSTTILTPEQVPPETLDPATEIARESPGTAFVDFSRFGDSYLTMRGVATLGAALNALDNTVGYSVDGMPTSLLGFNAPLLDVARIEVLKGPQGTTFGRNALAGSIDVVTVPVDGTRQYKVDAGIGTDGFGFLQGTVGGWIIPDAVAGRAVVRLENFDGDIPNVVIGGTDGGAEVGAARGALRFTPDATLAIDVAAFYSHNQNSDPSNILLEANNFPVSGTDFRPLNEQEIASGSVKVTKDFEGFRLTSVTGYQDIRVRTDADLTDALLLSAYTGFPGAVFNDPATDTSFTRERDKVFNQEFRINSAEGASWQWVLGTSFFHSDYSYDREIRTTYWPEPSGDLHNDITSQTVALFGDATVPLGERWEISGGLRLAHDEQELDGLFVGGGVPGTVSSFTQEQDYSDTYLTGRLALAYKWTPDLMSYASIARGYASGGFEKTTQYAAYGIETVAFDPATSWTYELGTKAKISDDLRLSGALFFNDVKDGQLSAFNTSTLTVYFASQDYQSYGFEGSAVATVAPGLNVTAGFSVMQSELVNVTAESAAAGAVEGNEVPQIPSFAATIGVDYRFNLVEAGIPGDFTASASYQFVGERVSDVTNLGQLDSYDIVNARLAWKKDELTVYGFGNNLLDERPVYYAVPIGAGASTAYVGRGQALGVGMTLEW